MFIPIVLNLNIQVSWKIRFFFYVTVAVNLLTGKSTRLMKQARFSKKPRCVELIAFPI